MTSGSTRTTKNRRNSNMRKLVFLAVVLALALSGCNAFVPPEVVEQEVTEVAPATAPVSAEQPQEIEIDVEVSCLTDECPEPKVVTVAPAPETAAPQSTEVEEFVPIQSDYVECGTWPNTEPRVFVWEGDPTQDVCQLGYDEDQDGIGDILQDMKNNGGSYVFTRGSDFAVSACVGGLYQDGKLLTMKVGEKEVPSDWKDCWFNVKFVAGVNFDPSKSLTFTQVGGHPNGGFRATLIK